MVVALFADVAAYGPMTAGSGFVAEQTDAPFSAMIEDDLPAGAAPGTYAAAATLPPHSDAGLVCWAATAAAFE